MPVEGIAEIIQAEAKAEMMIAKAQSEANALIKQAGITLEIATKERVEAQRSQNKLYLENARKIAENQAIKMKQSQESICDEVKIKASLNLSTAIQLVVERIVR
jgi:vacuolar-type H+-ATPase subunit H